MNRLIKKITGYFGMALMIIIGVIFFVVCIPLMLLLYPVTYYNRKKFEKQYSEFLIQNDNTNFFCYNNRKKSKDYIETQIIPNLNDSIEIVYLDGKLIRNENYPKEFLSNAFFELKSYSKFPHLMKIRDGKMIDKSINSIFFSIKHQDKPVDKLLVEIHEFFQLDQKSEII